MTPYFKLICISAVCLYRNYTIAAEKQEFRVSVQSYLYLLECTPFHILS